MSDDRKEIESGVVVGLLKEPRRLSELTGFAPSWFTTPEFRLLFWCARNYHQLAASEGKVRYATPAIVRRAVQDWAAQAKDKDKRRSRQAQQRAALSALDDVDSADPVDENDYRDLVDQLRSAAMDDIARDGIAKLAEEWHQSGAKGIANRLQDVAGQVSAAASFASNMGTLSRDAGLSLVDYEKAKNSPNHGYIPTPFARLNQVCGGGRGGRLWLTAGYAKDGKTQLAKELLYHAMVRKFGVLIFTGEQTCGDMRDMVIARHSHRFIPGGLSLRHISNGTLDAAHEKAYRETVRDLTSNRYGAMSYFQSPGWKVSQVSAVAEATARRQRVDVIMVDHTDLFEPSERQNSDVGRLARVIKELKELSLGFQNGRGVWVVACHQIKRDGYEAAIKRGFYVPSDMAGTAEAERSCDVMLWILRDEKMKDVSEARIGVALDRRSAGEPKGWAVYERFESAALLEIEDD